MEKNAHRATRCSIYLTLASHGLNAIKHALINASGEKAIEARGISLNVAHPDFSFSDPLPQVFRYQPHRGIPDVLVKDLAHLRMVIDYAKSCAIGGHLGQQVRQQSSSYLDERLLWIFHACEA